MISVEEISEVTLGMTDSAFMKVKQKIKTAKGDEVTENMAFTIRFKDTVKIGESYYSHVSFNGTLFGQRFLKKCPISQLSKK